MGSLLALCCGTLVWSGTLWATGVRSRLESQREALVEARTRLDGTLEQLIAAEKMTALGELVAGVAHEINNPLTGIIGHTQLLMQKQPPRWVRRRLATISAEAERMVKIVQNLLTFARRHTPEKRLLGLNGIIEKTLDLKAYQLRVNQIGVVKDLAPDLPMTPLDFHQIQQVLINLLNNAQQALAASGRGGTITLTTLEMGGRIEMRVSDDGPGIPAEIRDRIFEPFFTTKKEGKGTGLGLSLCYGIIQAHGGTIRVESLVGEGSTFIVSLPILPPESSQAQPAAPGPSRPVPPLRILVVDDEPSVLDFLVDFLSGRGHKVDTASDVPEALGKIAKGRHDLFITDLKMPRGTGQDIYRAILEKDTRLARRIIFISGHPPGEETQRFFDDIGTTLLRKPFGIEDVDRAIAGAVGAKNAHRDDAAHGDGMSGVV